MEAKWNTLLSGSILTPLERAGSRLSKWGTNLGYNIKWDTKQTETNRQEILSNQDVILSCVVQN